MGDLKIGNLPQVLPENNKNLKGKNPAEFGRFIEEAMQRAGKLEKNADTSIIDLLKGKAEIHETMIALQKVDISMRLLLSIRNKAIESYREIMRMQF